MADPTPGEDTSGFDALLNTSTPFAPGDEEEARRRLARTRPQDFAETAREDVPGPGEAEGKPSTERRDTREDEEARAPAGRSSEEEAGGASAADDIVGEFREIYAEARALARSFAAARMPAGVWKAADASGTVQVTIDDGQRVTNVRFLRRPDAGHGVAGLTAAILDAVGAALSERLENWAESLPEPGVSFPREEDREEFPVWGFEAGNVDPLAVVGYATTLFDEFDRRIAGLREAARDGSASPESTGVSTNRRVKVTLRGRTVSRIEIDGNWWDKVGLDRLGTSVNEAFQDAYREAARRAESDGNPMAEVLDSISRDCEELYRLIGFHHD